MCFPDSRHRIFGDYRERTRRYGRAEFLDDIIAQRPLKIISFFEQPAQYQYHVPVFTQAEIELSDELAQHETVIGVAKSHFSLAKFTPRSDGSFLQLCSGIKIMFDHWVHPDKTFQMSVFDLEFLSSADGIPESRVRHGDYKSMPDQIEFIKRGRWVHFPSNNTEWFSVSQIYQASDCCKLNRTRELL